MEISLLSFVQECKQLAKQALGKQMSLAAATLRSLPDDAGMA